MSFAVVLKKLGTAKIRIINTHATEANNEYGRPFPHFEFVFSIMYPAIKSVKPSNIFDAHQDSSNRCR